MTLVMMLNAAAALLCTAVVLNHGEGGIRDVMILLAVSAGLGMYMLDCFYVDQ